MEHDLRTDGLVVLQRFLRSGSAPAHGLRLSGLDGLLTGIVAGPEPVPPAEWLPVILGGDEPDFESAQQAAAITGTINDRYNRIAAIMQADSKSLEPILSPGPKGEPGVTDWAAGFLAAIKLREPAWQPLLQHRRARLLVVPLLILGDDDGHFQHRPGPREKEFYAAQSDVVQICAVGIYDFWRDWLRERRAATVRRRSVRRR